MIQDISPKKLINHYDPAVKPREGDLAILFRGDAILVRGGCGELAFPTVADAGDALCTARYLFSVSPEDELSESAGPDKRTTVRYFSMDGGQDFPGELPGYEWVPFRSLRENRLRPADQVLAAYTARHLRDWYRDTRFCGRCGARMTHSDKERAMVCACGNTVYPRIMPAVIIGVIRGDTLLLTRYRGGFRHNALVAGFCEIGETMEETVTREVMEETGLRVRNIRYYKSQPWGVANDMLAGFYCDAVEGDEIRMDENELSVARFVPRQEIVLQPDGLSLTNEMMKRFKDLGPEACRKGAM